MNITVLQGLNLKHAMTTVVAEMAAAKPELFDFYKTLHPIFLDNFMINGTTVDIQTHLPNLWKNSGFLAPFEAHATGKITLDEARLRSLEIVKILVSSMSSIPFLRAAHTRGYETVPVFVNEGILSRDLFNRYYTIGIGKESEIMVAAASTRNSLFSFKAQRDKWTTNLLISALGLPIAPWEHVHAREQLQEIAERIGFPLVIKPVGLTGGHAVFVGVQTVEELLADYDKIKEEISKKPILKPWQAEIIVQKLVEGEDHRILVIGGKAEIATHRIPARVTGDGKSTISQLIEAENLNPARDVSLPTHTLKPIVIDDELMKLLSEQGVSLDDVLENDRIVPIRKVASMSQGGITEDVTDRLHPQIALICETISESIHAHILGIDVICKDISQPLTIENGSIIEMNTMCETYLNAFPVIGKQYPDIGEKMVDSLVDSTIHTNTVVVIGDIPSNTISDSIIKSLGQQPKIGLLHNGSVSINDQPVNTSLTTREGVLCLKKNASLDTIVLHYDTADEISENGFGFNTIDLLITTKTALEPIKEVVDHYIAQKLINRTVVV